MILIAELVEARADINPPVFKTCVISSVMVELAEIETAGTITLPFPEVPPEGTK
jgi:hypothetical protein